MHSVTTQMSGLALSAENSQIDTPTTISGRDSEEVSKSDNKQVSLDKACRHQLNGDVTPPLDKLDSEAHCNIKSESAFSYDAWPQSDQSSSASKVSVKLTEINGQSVTPEVASFSDETEASISVTGKPSLITKEEDKPSAILIPSLNNSKFSRSTLWRQNHSNLFVLDHQSSTTPRPKRACDIIEENRRNSLANVDRLVKAEGMKLNREHMLPTGTANGIFGMKTVGQFLDIKYPMSSQRENDQPILGLNRNKCDNRHGQESWSTALIETSENAELNMPNTVSRPNYSIRLQSCNSDQGNSLANPPSSNRQSYLQAEPASCQYANGNDCPKTSKPQQAVSRSSKSKTCVFLGFFLIAEIIALGVTCSAFASSIITHFNTLPLLNETSSRLSDLRTFGGISLSMAVLLQVLAVLSNFFVTYAVHRRSRMYWTSAVAPQSSCTGQQNKANLSSSNKDASERKSRQQTLEGSHNERPCYFALSHSLIQGKALHELNPKSLLKHICIRILQLILACCFFLLFLFWLSALIVCSISLFISVLLPSTIFSCEDMDSPSHFRRLGSILAVAQRGAELPRSMTEMKSFFVDVCLMNIGPFNGNGEGLSAERCSQIQQFVCDISNECITSLPIMLVCCFLLTVTTVLTLCCQSFNFAHGSGIVRYLIGRTFQKPKACQVPSSSQDKNHRSPKVQETTVQINGDKIMETELSNTNLAAMERYRSRHSGTATPPNANSNDVATRSIYMGGPEAPQRSFQDNRIV